MLLVVPLRTPRRRHEHDRIPSPASASGPASPPARGHGEHRKLARTDRLHGRDHQDRHRGPIGRDRRSGREHRVDRLDFGDGINLGDNGNHYCNDGRNDGRNHRRDEQPCHCGRRRNCGGCRFRPDVDAVRHVDPRELIAMKVERKFRAMGSDAHVIVEGGAARTEAETAELALGAIRRIADLERRWSRFEPDSEVSALTRHAGSAVVVTPDTRELVEHAVAAWRFTRGLFDPTVLGALLRAGYHHSFETVGSAPTGLPSALTTGANAIEIIGNTVRLPAGTGFDAGGIGKGLAADIVAGEVRAAGAAGVCINLGGDVRVDGESPSGNAWTIAVDHPASGRPITRVAIERGAVATSTTLRRHWRVDGEPRHHLIDPATGLPSNTTLTFVTVVAGHAWMAEVLAKATLLRGTRQPFDLAVDSGAQGLAVDRDGHVFGSAGVAAFLADPLPPVVAPDYAATA
jgi:FAD:protein FMN transferase